MDQCENEMKKLTERWDYDNKLDKLRRFACAQVYNETLWAKTIQEAV